MLIHQMQGTPGCGQDPQRRRFVQQPAHDEVGIGDLLQVVQDQQRHTVGEEPENPFVGKLVGITGRTDGLTDTGPHDCCSVCAVQGDEVHLLTQSLLEVCGHGDCQSGLARPARSGQRHQARSLVERAGDLVELAGPADQISGVAGQVRRGAQTA